MCPSCEAAPIVNHGVCLACERMYIESLGPNWATETEVGLFLVESNRQTRGLSERVAHNPTGYKIESLPEMPKTEEDVVSETTGKGVEEILRALVLVHGYGTRKAHSFLSKSGYTTLTMRSIQRRVVAIKRERV
jgi:hypothetical protein